ncbi:MAG: RNA polymerase sigma factor [Rugosibacter sp.]|jgi:RNA polymerase sigma-70 factor, ECF subfamily|nr:RNA polymerase sigma factor [Rugosibacter sp.]
MNPVLNSRIDLSDFLASIERRAFKQAMFAVKNREVALDVVQDAMMKLSEKYSARPANEWPMLFQRILQNTIRDSFRRSNVRSLWISLFSSFLSDNDDETDPLDIISATSEHKGLRSPQQQIEQTQLLGIIEAEIEKLPARQREAFLMRYLEELNINETALAMGCSEGSVKTHCSRATHTLAVALKAKGIAL